MSAGVISPGRAAARERPGLRRAAVVATLGLTVAPGPDGIPRAADAGLLVAGEMALLGAATSATRPGLDAGADPAGARPADRSISWEDGR